MSQLRNQFARRLRTLRIQRQLSQEELAKLAQLSTSFISNLERGLNAPSFESLNNLAHALDVSVKDLFDFED